MRAVATYKYASTRHNAMRLKLLQVWGGKDLVQVIALGTMATHMNSR